MINRVVFNPEKQSSLAEYEVFLLEISFKKISFKKTSFKKIYLFINVMCGCALRCSLNQP